MNDPEKAKQEASDNQVIEDAPGNLISDCDGSRDDSANLVSAADAHNNALTVSISGEFVISLVLSLGIAIALIVFALECLEHPSAANLIIPLIVGPAGTVIVNLLRCKRCRKEKHDANEGER